jgi:small subunit ribosomal protein S17
MQRRSQRKTKKGIVVSDKMNKSIVVSVERKIQHPLYRKLIKKTSKVLAHDEENRCRVGDVVTIVETRPLSRHKRWRVEEITSSAGEEEIIPEGAEGEGDLQ